MSFTLQVDDEISLRLIEPEHAQAMYAVIDANREHIHNYLPWATPTSSLEDVRAFATKTLVAFAQRKELSLSILEHGQVVGGTGWNHWVCETKDEWQLSMCHADIGYWLARDAQGRGIVTRAVRALLRLGFEQYGMARMTIRAEPENVRSYAVPERLGFTYEGTLRHVCHWKDRWVNHRLYSMLRDEWRESCRVSDLGHEGKECEKGNKGNEGNRDVRGVAGVVSHEGAEL